MVLAVEIIVCCLIFGIYRVIRIKRDPAYKISNMPEKLQKKVMHMRGGAYENSSCARAVSISFSIVFLSIYNSPDYTDKTKYIFPHPFFLHSWHNRSCLSDTASHSGLYSGALLSVLLPPSSHLPYIIAVNLSSTFLISCKISF